MKNKLLKDVFKKGDIILVLVLAVAVILTAVFATRTEDSFVEIYVDGVLAFQLDLSKDTTLDLNTTSYKIDLIVTVKSGKAYVTHSDCPDKLCVESSGVSSVGGLIVCLPNKVVVKVTPKEVDAIS